MRIPGISVVHYKLLGNSFHQRMWNILLLDCALHICQFRVEKLRTHIRSFKRMTLLSHVSPCISTKWRHCTGIMESHISLWFPLESLRVKDVVITSKIIQVDIGEAWTSRCWLCLLWSNLFNCCYSSTLFFSINNIKLSQACCTIVN